MNPDLNWELLGRIGLLTKVTQTTRLKILLMDIVLVTLLIGSAGLVVAVSF